MARAIADPDNRSAEFAILVRSDLKGQGVVHALLGKMIRYCRARGTREIIGEVLTGNAPMLALAASHGLKAQNIPADPSVVRISLRLNSELPDLAAELELGGLVAYGPSISDLWRRAAVYVDKMRSATSSVMQNLSSQAHDVR